MTVHPVTVDHQHLARLEIADMAGTDNVQSAGFGRHDPAVANPAKHQRAHAIRVPNADQHVIGNADKRVGTLDLLQRVGQPPGDIRPVRSRDKMNNHLGIG